MKNRLFYRKMVFVGLVIWFATTAYFGWKLKPVSGVDGMLSSLGIILVGWGVLGDVVNNLTIIKRSQTIINTKNVEVDGVKKVSYKQTFSLPHPTKKEDADE
ncbi:MAG TPA: hypothetical protein VJ836_00655 [Candidatus Saccharimonadales bacterium]|nr:hypothetical protein [Candidatus Saccharimonadales bacterium]